MEGHIVGDQNQITALGILRGLHAHLPGQHANVITALRALRPQVSDRRGILETSGNHGPFIDDLP